MSSKDKGKAKGQAAKKKGGNGKSTTINLRGDRLLAIDVARTKMSQKAGADIRRSAVVNTLIDEGLKVVQKRA